MKHTRPAVVVLAGVLAGGFLAVPFGAASADPPPAGAPPTTTVTLVTGDQVVLGGQRGATVLPGEGRSRIRFTQRTDQFGNVHVVPEDAAEMLRTRRIDPRLFNVTQLAKHGFSDTARKDIPLIVSGGAGLAAAKVRDLASVRGAAVRVDKSTGLRSFTSAERIWLDGPVRATLDKTVPQIGAPEAWRSGHTGKGATVAVLDTGIDASHPDLDDAIADAKNFTDAPTTDDNDGHGTHVASTITGDHEKFGGVAPDAKLLNGKVLSDMGGQESWVIAGMEWAAGKGADVVNMSLGGEFPSDGTDPLSQAVNRITAETGTLFVISSGNSGGSISTPGAADAALTVGAVDHNDQLAPFSSRGPRFRDEAIKPDITAPGVDVVAAKAKDKGQVAMSGTSMAAPHVAGAAAILAAQHPGWQATQLKSALMGNAKPHPALTVFEQGAGRVDVARAVRQSVHAEPASISAGLAQWPHNDDVPITKTLTYTNSGSASSTLNLTADVRDPAGKPAPAGMFTFSPSTVTVPAGGQAQATLTIDTRVNAPDGRYSGVINSGDIRTPVAIHREVENYTVTLKPIGRDGSPATDYHHNLADIDRPESYFDETGKGILRVPKGRYNVHLTVRNGGDVTALAEPEYVVDRDSTLVMDAREGKPVGFAVDKPNAKAGSVFVGFERKVKWGPGTVVDHYLLPSFDGFFVRPSSTQTAPGQFRYFAEARLAEPDGKGGFMNSPYLYHLLHQADAKVPADLVRRVRDHELANVRSEHASTAPDRYGSRDLVVIKALPFTLDEFYTPDVPWYANFAQHKTPVLSFDNESELSTSVPRTFKRGSTTTERWNYGVFGPSAGPGSTAGAQRLGDDIMVSVPMHTDQAVNRRGRAKEVGWTQLYRDGTWIGTQPGAGSGSFDVPSGPAVYRLHTESHKELTVSSKITVDWTFKSDTVAGEEYQPLPLMAVRFAPRLNAQNRASAVVPTLVPITVEHGSGGRAQTPSIQVSHDEGATWQPARVLTVGGKWFTVISHPAGAKSVSLKATVGDTGGNSVEQTVIRAFLL